MDRRTFLKLTGIGSLSAVAGCSGEAEKHLYSLVEAPDDMVTGMAAWYASTCRECSAGCGIIARNREGRVVKLEGNPLHPINQGKLCARGQAALQAVYNPDRLKAPLLKQENTWRPISFQEAELILKEQIKASTGKTRLLTEVTGDVTLELMSEFMNALDSPAPLLFEPIAYETLKTANALCFGMDGLPSYQMEKADFILGFGADFLETWLSPVEYARKFKEMHGYDGHKGVFIQISPLQTLTAVNADQWISCIPGTEAAAALGCLRESLESGKGMALPADIRESLQKAAASYTPENVVSLTGMNADHYRSLIRRMLKADAPLIIGQGADGMAENALQTNIAANLLNLVLDPALSLIDFNERHRVEIAARRSELYDFFENIADGNVSLLLLNNINPVYSLPLSIQVEKSLQRDDLFSVSFSNFMDETSALADLIIPTALPLERWGSYAGKPGLVSTLQPAMGSLTGAPDVCSLLKKLISGKESEDGARQIVYSHLIKQGKIQNQQAWLSVIRQGGIFEASEAPQPTWKFSWEAAQMLQELDQKIKEKSGQHVFAAVPSLRFYDGRGGNKPWLSELPDPLTKVAWQSPVLMHPKALYDKGLKQGDVVEIETASGRVEAPVYAFTGIHPQMTAISMGQGHQGFGRYANSKGVNPLHLLSGETDNASGGPSFAVLSPQIKGTGKQMPLANTDGSKFQHGRKIAETISLKELHSHDDRGHHSAGFGMHEFPLVLPLPEGYDPHRDVYPPHEHQNDYRWAMAVDLDRCIGCGACSVACYAENNIGVVGEERILEGREMSWIRIERYHDEKRMDKVVFLPMMCQHCDNAPCESVCPVYAPHHGKEGMNNQIYNRCIGTRYCSQNCPYKVRRFNWFEWERPAPLPLQLNPDVTVRMRGVMEKCSFCVQRVKYAHGVAKNEKRRIRDGEVQPACVQTCPTGALVFGNIADKESRVRKMAEDKRAYQVMGYLNTKTAVIYLKKVVREI